MVTAPQPQRRCCNRCSTTSSRTTGRSNTCRASVETTGAPRNDRSHREHRPGRCTTTLSGTSTCRSVNPGVPGCLPALRPEDSRRDFGAALTGASDDGGFDDVRESLRSNASNSATRRVNTSISASRSASASSNRASRSTSSARSGSDTTTSMP